MSSSERREPASLAPKDALDLLGNETRLQILGALAGTEGPISFTELRDRVGVSRGANFNYHLEKIVGKFVEKTDDGYDIRLPGSRIVQAVLSTAVSEDPVIGPTPVDQSCYHCGSSIMMTYFGSHISIFCTECSGNYYLRAPPSINQANLADSDGSIGFLGGLELPPAGVVDRSDSELLSAGITWQNLERQAIGFGICPRCSGKPDTTIEICETHDADEGVCDDCHHRYAIQQHQTCTNCNYDRYRQMGRLLLSTTELLHFVSGHGINPIAPESPIEFMSFLDKYKEEVISVEPFEGSFTFTIDGESITLSVDNNLNVIGMEEGKSTR